MSKSSALTAFQIGFQCCPIILTDGIAQLMLGGMLPIIALTEAANFLDGILSGGVNLDPDQYFAHFSPAPGAKLISNNYGTVPFANQTVAANAVISEPLNLSLRMACPAKNFAAKLATVTALKTVLEMHSNMGGSYTVITPAYFLTNCLLRDLTYIGDQGTQKQVFWQWDFYQPLITEAQALASYNGMMQRIAGGLPSTGALSGSETILGNPLSLSAGSLLPSASSTPASSLAAGEIPL